MNSQRQRTMRHRLITVEHTVESFILWRGISMGSVPKCVIQELGEVLFRICGARKINVY